MHTPRALVFTSLLFFAPGALAQEHGALAQEHGALAQEPAGLFESVARTLERRFYDKEFRTLELPAIADRYRAAADACETLAEERAVVHDFLANIPASHLALVSRTTYDHMFAELSGRGSATFGFQLVELEGQYYVDWVFEGGPAERAGLRRGDQVIAIEGVAPGESVRLDWRSDDAALPDPAIHEILGVDGESLEFTVRPAPGEEVRRTVRAMVYSGMDAARASARIVESGPYRFGYVHFWYIPFMGPSGLLKELFADRFADCDGLIVDLRGRGGAVTEVGALLNLLDPQEGQWRRPLVLLTHAETRSAKEVIAYQLRRKNACFVVGETTAGAVIPATFADVGHDTMLMFPAFTLPGHTRLLEGIGVTPDIEVAGPLPFAGGRDPIFRAGIIALDEWCRALPALRRRRASAR